MRRHYVVPFFFLGLSAFACSSSSSPATAEDSGLGGKDTGTTAHPDGGTPTKDGGHKPDGTTTPDAHMNQADVESHDAKTSHDARSTDAKSTDVESHDAKSTDARPTDAKPTDAKSTDAKSTDAHVKPKPDSGMDSGVDAGPPTPEGTTLDTGSGFAIAGVTDDGYVVYTTSSAIKVAPVQGGTATTLAVAGDGGAFGAVVSHKVVFLWTNGGLTLSIWTHAAGTVTGVSAASVGGVAAASADSSSIVYMTGTSADGTNATFVGASTATPTATTTLATHVDVSFNNQACGPALAFSNANAVASFCTLGDAGGSADAGDDDEPPTVYSYPSSTWTGQLLATNAVTYQADTTGVAVAVALGAQLAITKQSSGASLDIDTASALSATSPALYLSTSDSFVLYATAAGALRTSPTTSSTPTTLAASDVNAIDGVSASEAWALVNNGTDSTTGLPSDLSLASTSVAGTPSSLTTGTTVAAVLGGAFTTDSNYAVFMTGITVDMNDNAIGVLSAVATAHPGTLIPLATLAVNDTNFSPSDLALSASELSFTDNFNANVGVNGSVDLKVVNLATTTPPTTVMKGADPGYAVSFDKKYILYVITFGGSTDGLYSIAAPVPDAG